MAENEIWNKLGLHEGRLESAERTISRAHSRIDEAATEAKAESAAQNKAFDDFKMLILEKFTKYAEVQARHTVIVGIACSVITVIVVKFLGGS